MDKCNPKVSVVMGVYNGEDHIAEAIDSILKQSYSNFEFIIIDDASTDRTSQIINDYSDIRIKLFRNPSNLGLTRSLNIAIQNCRGIFIARQDADDASLPNRLHEQIQFLEANPNIGLLGTRTLFVDESGKEFSRWAMPINNEDIKNGLELNNSFCHGSVIFRKTCIDSVGAYREKFIYTQDYDLWLRISEKFEVANLEKYLYKMRRGSHSISRKKLEQQANLHLLALNLHIQREQTGADSYNEVNLAHGLEKFIISKFGLSKHDIKEYKITIINSYYEEAKAYGDIKGLKELSLKAFYLSPNLKSLISLIITYAYILKKTMYSFYQKHIGWRLK